MNISARHLVYITSALLLFACAQQHPFLWADEVPREAEVQTIESGDRISVLVKNQEQLSGEFPVRANGTYPQPVVGEVAVAGMTRDSAAKHVAALLKGIVTDPLVSVSVSTPRNLLISVLGEVTRPGSVEVPLGEGVLGVLARAGGLTEFADRDGIFVLRKKPEQLRIRFRYSDLVGGVDGSSTFRLRDGDIVVVE